MMEAENICEESVNFYRITRHYNPEDSHLHTSAMRISNITKSTRVTNEFRSSFLRGQVTRHEFTVRKIN
jgi:hypothetical protein